MTTTTNYYAYDKSQRMITRYALGGEAHYFTYNQRNMVTQIQDWNGAGDALRSCVYNGLGERVIATDNSSASPAYWSYDGRKFLEDKQVGATQQDYRQNQACQDTVFGAWFALSPFSFTWFTDPYGSQCFSNSGVNAMGEVFGKAGPTSTFNGRLVQFTGQNNPIADTTLVGVWADVGRFGLVQQDAVCGGSVTTELVTGSGGVTLCGTGEVLDDGSQTGPCGDTMERKPLIFQTVWSLPPNSCVGVAPVENPSLCGPDATDALEYLFMSITDKFVALQTNDLGEGDYGKLREACHNDLTDSQFLNLTDLDQAVQSSSSEGCPTAGCERTLSILNCCLSVDLVKQLILAFIDGLCLGVSLGTNLYPDPGEPSNNIFKEGRELGKAASELGTARGTFRNRSHFDRPFHKRGFKNPLEGVCVSDVTDKSYQPGKGCQYCSLQLGPLDWSWRPIKAHP